MGFLKTTAAGIILLASQVKAQHKCGTDIHYANLIKNHPEIIQSQSRFDSEVIEYKKIKSTVNKRATTYTIPVVFHVIHTNGPENISRDQILDQIRVLNEDFSYTNANKSSIRSQFVNRVGSADISFELASVDPNGNCFDGINRIYSTQGVDMSMNDEPVKDLAYWNYKKYLNIWVVTNIVDGSGTGTVLGYAVFPWTAGFNKDGIVMRHDRVGTIGTAINSDGGRTLTHEIGHWLGLYHTFQGGCNSGDGCGDTPPVNGTFTNANCPANGNSCTNDSPDELDMWENYMDYSDGNCMAAFTFDQIDRMHTSLTSNPRNSNTSSSNLISTGVVKQATKPLAEFTSSSTVVCAGTPVKFYDLSCKGLPTIRSWTIQGSNNPSPTTTNPEVIYQSPGTYSVSLTVQNSYGNTTETKTDYITVLPSVSQAYPNFEEGFEEGDPTSDGRIVNLSPVGTQFKIIDQVAFTGNKSFYAPITTGSNPGKVYSFKTQSFNLKELSGTSSPKITFYTSYAQPSADVSEILRIYISTDCGGSWEQIFERSGTALSYLNAPYTSNFKPTATSQWKRQGLGALDNLGYGDAENAIFRIDVVSAGGNPIYIDNINISQWYANTNHINKDLTELKVYPNPAINDITLQFNSHRKIKVLTISLIDQTGREIFSTAIENIELGFSEQNVSLPKLAAGLYYLNINTAEGSATQTLNIID
ncbi:MAG: M43 family zinc metalloprotease [Bacteroidia bacterium]